MVKDAELHAEEDRQRKELVAQKNQRDSLAHTLEKLLAEHQDLAHRAEVEDALRAARLQLAGNDKVAIAAATSSLREHIQRTQENSGDAKDEASGNKGAQAGGEPVIDAEYEERPSPH